MDLAMGQRLERRQAEFVSEGVDAGVAQQGDAGAVGFGDGRVSFERAVFLLRDALGEIFAVVEVFEDGTDGGEVLVLEVDAALLRGVRDGILVCRGS
jgi:hypothetical protein